MTRMTERQLVRYVKERHGFDSVTVWNPEHYGEHHSKLFLCTRGVERFVLKKYNLSPGHKSEWRQRAHTEISVNSKNWNSLDLPEVIDYDYDTPFLLSRYAQAQDIQPITGALTPELARKVVDSLIRVHSTPAVHGVEELDPKVLTARANDIGRLVRAGRLALEDGRTIDRLLRFGQRTLPKIPKTFTHGDFWFGNMHRNKDELRPHDFETAAYDSPLYDVATIYLSNYHNPVREVIKDEYFRRAVPSDYPVDPEIVFDLMLARRAVGSYAFIALHRRNPNDALLRYAENCRQAIMDVANRRK